MLKFRYAAAIGLGALLLGACEHFGAEATGVSGGFELEEARATSAPSSPFEAGLYAGYLDLAQAEFNRGDYEDSDRFARRAEAVAAGKRVQPEHPITHRWIPEEHRAELFNEVFRLQKALRAGARDWAPEAAARAQTMYDCWVEEQEENFQPEDIAACRNAYLAAMAEVEAAQPGEAMGEPMPAPGPYVVFFEFDSAILTTEARATLDEVVDDADGFGPAVVIVRGHTDRAGGDAYNMTLSQRRAEAVSDYLQAHGIDAGSIAVDWFGESKPMVATADGVPEQANRRVEIEFEK